MGKSRQTTIEINGRMYDALTGKLITSVTTLSAPDNTRIIPHSNGTSIDGISVGTKSSSTPKPRHKRDLGDNPAAQVHHTSKRSQTLQRGAVTKPKIQRTKKVENRSGTLVVPRRDQSRLERALRIGKSLRISKFSTAATHTNHTPDSQVETPVQPSSKLVTHVPSEKERLIAQSIARVATLSAPVHSQKKRIKTWFARSRNSTLVAATFATLLLAGYVTYLNIPRIAMRVASNRAGFQAELPGYKPSGFVFSGPIAYGPGNITLEYISTTDNRRYTIAQKETNWDSQTLLDNFVERETDLYSTYQERGLTVYVYDGSNATWVNGGIWYTVAGQSQLTSEQLLKIAASL